MKRFRKNSFTILVVISLLIITWTFIPYRGVPVLTYHHIGDAPEWYYVSASSFEYQMALLKFFGYSPISIQDLVAGFSGQKDLPWKPIVLTFDDGYKDNWTTAVPILEKYGFTATFFVVTGRSGKSDYMSWQDLQAMQKKGMEIGSHTANHYTLNEINLNEFSRELILSRIMLENNLRLPVNIFANPHGETTPEVVSMLKKAGYNAACSSIMGSNFPNMDSFLIRRMTIKNTSGRFGLISFHLRLFVLDAISKFPPLTNLLYHFVAPSSENEPNLS